MPLDPLDQFHRPFAVRASVRLRRSAVGAIEQGDGGVELHARIVRPFHQLGQLGDRCVGIFAGEFINPLIFFRSPARIARLAFLKLHLLSPCSQGFTVLVICDGEPAVFSHWSALFLVWAQVLGRMEVHPKGGGRAN